ncbi:MAG TPA: XRE family transcriptional regulator [Chloroflexota bacterium]
MDSQDPRQLLARRLRALREESWPDRKITQPQLARALGGVSVPLISSYESQTKPQIPPLSRLNHYAALFATPRSFDEDPGHLISPQDMTDEELRTMNELKQDLLGLRNGAMRAGAATQEHDRPDEISMSLSSGPWRFEDGKDITIVCAQWPRDVLQRIPYTSVDDPDYIELLTYSELDSLVALYGHLRAANPTNQVNFRTANKLTNDDYTSHLVALGGIDWNTVTSSALRRLELPVRQIADWDTEGGQYFEVEESGTTTKHNPVLEESGGQLVLREDVALFARAVNPFNRKRTITICNGMYGRGTYGVVRALIDTNFRDRNAEYLQSRFGDSDSYCILTRVPIVNGSTLTPDWTLDEYKLFEWAG